MNKDDIDKMSKEDKIKLAHELSKNLKTRGTSGLPKILNAHRGNIPTIEEKQEIEKGVMDALGKATGGKAITTSAQSEQTDDTYLRFDGSELMVVTKTKQLIAYVVTATRKTPKDLRFTFANRLQNYALDALENMVLANSLNKREAKNAIKRKEHQHKAYMQLKLLGYMSFIAFENKALTQRQYIQICKQLNDSMNLLLAWSK